MLIDFTKAIKDFDLKITGIIQVGAHYGEETEEYLKLGVEEIILIEPCAEAFSILADRHGSNPKVKLLKYAIGSKNGVVNMNTEKKNNGQSNSILKPKLHLQQFPDIVFNGTERVVQRKLDELILDKSKYNTLVMDVQGYEGEVLRGAEDILEGIDVVYTEVNRDEVYENCTQINELDMLLSEFDRVQTSWDGGTWGDAIYKRKSITANPDDDQVGIVNVPSYFRPKAMFQYPPDNEIDFERWYFDNFRKENIRSRIYLPIMWTAYLVKNNYGKSIRALKKLQEFINTLDTTKKYYTIVQYDDGPVVDLSGIDIKVYSMSGKPMDYPLPLISMPHHYEFDIDRDIFASFVGRKTHPIRSKMMEALNGKREYYISSNQHSLHDYCKILSRSVFGLCPRGYGINSFRVQECLQYGAIPVIISDELFYPHGVQSYHYGVLVQPKDISKLDESLKNISNQLVEELQSQTQYIYESFFTYKQTKKLILSSL